MRTVIQTAAGAANFDGVTTGVVDFLDLPLPPGEQEMPIVVAVALEVGALTNLLDFDCRLERPPGTATTERITIANVLQTAGFSQAGCELPVPRLVVGTPNVYTPWVLRITTANKSGAFDCSLIVSYDVGRILRG